MKNEPTLSKLICVSCGAQLTVEAELVGARIYCPKCEQLAALPGTDGSRGTNANRIATFSEASVGAPASESLIDPSEKTASESMGKFGRYELRELLGAGAFGQVYKAFDPLLERFVALKVPTFSLEDQQRV